MKIKAMDMIERLDMLEGNGSLYVRRRVRVAAEDCAESWTAASRSPPVRSVISFFIWLPRSMDYDLIIEPGIPGGSRFRLHTSRRRNACGIF